MEAYSVGEYMFENIDVWLKSNFTSKRITHHQVQQGTIRWGPACPNDTSDPVYRWGPGSDLQGPGGARKKRRPSWYVWHLEQYQYDCKLCRNFADESHVTSRKHQRLMRNRMSILRTYPSS